MNARTLTLGLSLLTAVTACNTDPAADPTESDKAPLQGQYGYEMADDPILDASPDPTSSLPSEVPDRLPPEMIQSAVRSARASFSACKDAAIVRGANPAGAVRLRFVIDPAGDVHDVTVLSTPEAPLGECVRGVISTLELPASHHGSAEVVYPIVFN
ncbi:MAG: AgmX/PglI C-terminal domain-containing protein [Polyangiaceae bacterium]